MCTLVLLLHPGRWCFCLSVLSSWVILTQKFTPRNIARVVTVACKDSWFPTYRFWQHFFFGQKKTMQRETHRKAMVNDIGWGGRDLGTLLNERLHPWKLTRLAGKFPCSIGNTSTQMVDVPLTCEFSGGYQMVSLQFQLTLPFSSRAKRYVSKLYGHWLITQTL